MSKNAKTTDKPRPKIAENRKARHDYTIEDTYEAGMSLMGWEVKSLRAGRSQLKEAYVYIRNDEAFLLGAHFSPLTSASTHVIADPVRTRKLLLNKSELEQLANAVDRKGYTIVPLELYWKGSRVKLRIGVAKGKQAHDKRESSKDRDWERERGRLMKSSRR